MSNTLIVIFMFAFSCLGSWSAWCADGYEVEQAFEGVVVIRDDQGAWGGASMGTSHQNRPEYQVKKLIDLAQLPPGSLQSAHQARLSVFFAVQDYSWNVGDRTWNGLDEAFELHVNGHVHTYRTKEGFPGRASSDEKLYWDWHDFLIPTTELKPGVNEFLIKKAPGSKGDDYIYVGIDNSVAHGHSQMSSDGGQTWRTDRLNAIDATGEYMVRLVLIEADLSARVTWLSGPPASLEDEQGLVGYAGEEDGRLRLEVDGRKTDPQQPVQAAVTSPQASELKVEWLDAQDTALQAASSRLRDTVTVSLPPGLSRPATLRVSGAAAERVVISYYGRYLPLAPRVDMCPVVQSPSGRPAAREVSCVLWEDTALLGNPYMRCEFRTGPRLELLSLVSEFTQKECLAAPEKTKLFMVEVAQHRFGAQDFEVVDIKQIEGGFEAALLLPERGIAATLTVSIGGGPELRMGLKVQNPAAAAGPVTFKVAFPHLDGVCLSQTPEEDFYLFPYFGGTIANVPTYLRTAYGENSAWWQMIDVFSPARGGGLYIRSADTTGLFKCPALRKGTGYGEYSYNTIGTIMDRSLWWEDSLGSGPHTAMCFEYLQRTREPGSSFEPPQAAIGVHQGDWRVALQRYADWAHDAWDWRPYPSRLTDRWSITAPGWGQAPLFKDGQFRTDFLKEGVDVAELMSFWEWSDVGPWRVPMDHETLPKDLGEALYKRYKPYWVENPATGKLQYPLNRGDYRYNETWGGLEALRGYVKRIQDAGTLATYYVEGILACDSTDVGHEYGPTYGVMNPLWEDAYKCPRNPPGYVASYGSWNMCADTEWWPEYLAQTYSRLLKDTGADGLRLDEYGHRGYVCHNDKHQHIFAEPGHNAWLQAVGRACRVVHTAMDEVAPDLVLTTEFPGMDYMAASLEGALVYETRSHITPFRPVPCNLFRFFFPECKVFDIYLDEGIVSSNLKLWNGSGTFAGDYPLSYYRILAENTDAFEGDVAPLIPTLKPRLYINRFGAADKTIYTLYNATGFTYDGPVLEVTADKDTHYVDLLNCRELEPLEQDGERVLVVKIKRDWMSCVAALPESIALEGGEEGLQVTVPELEGQLELVLADIEGAAIMRMIAEAGQNVLQIPANAEPACVKLLLDGQLADIRAL